MKRIYGRTIVLLLILALLPGYAGASGAESCASAAQTVNYAATVPMPSLSPDQLSQLYEEYTIKKGDCLISIGKKFGIPWRYLAALNGIQGPKYTIIAGRTLKIPLLPKLPGTTGNYLILCETEAQKRCIAEFAAYKTWRGFTVTVKSVKGDVKPAANTDTSEAIRQYLKKMDQKMSLEYVLLIGTPYDENSRCPQHTGGIIPMKYLYYNPTNHNTKYNCDGYDYKNPQNSGFNSPTDIYYAFDFNWDYDADGYPGEIDEVAESVMQAKPELLFLLGRIPFSDITDIGTVLQTTMQYELSQKAHSTALVGSFGIWAYYGDALAKNLIQANIETTTIFDSDGDESFQYKGTCPYNNQDFNLEVRKNYDFLYTMDDFGRFHVDTSPGDGAITGIYFIDAFATLRIEPGGGDDRLTAQDVLADGLACAAIATTRRAGFNPKNPAPQMPSLLFTNKTLCISSEFYAAELSTIVDDSVWGNLPIAYAYCYLGDPSIELKP